MRNKNFLAVQVTLLIILFIYHNWRDEKPYPVDKKFPIQQLQEDLLQLEKVLKQYNPALDFLDRKQAFDLYFDSANAAISKNLTVSEFYVLISPLVAKLNCGHTSVSFPEFYWASANQNYKYFPYKLFFQGNRAYVVKNYSKDSVLPPGTQIISVNNIPIPHIIDNFLNRISSDGFNQTFKYFKMNVKDYGLFPGYTVFPDSFDIEYIVHEDSQKRKITIEARSHNEISRIRKKEFINFEYKPYEFTIIDSLDAAILKIKDFIGYSETNYRNFLESSFMKLNSEGSPNLIIDVRNNDGGDPGKAAELLCHLTDEPFVYFTSNVVGYGPLKKPIQPYDLNFKGSIYVLINGGSFSTTGHLISLIKYLKLGILIGEETGGSYWCYSCPRDFKLPNTKLVSNLNRCMYTTKVSDFKRGRGIMPDFEVKPEIGDMIENKDTVISFTLDPIKNQSFRKKVTKIDK